MAGKSLKMWGIIMIVASGCSGVKTHDTFMNTTVGYPMTSTLMEYVDETTVESDFNADSSGWAWYPLRWSWWFIAQVVCAILGIIGNSVVIVVIYQRIATIRSTDIFIGALAIADFLTSVFLLPIPWARRVPATTLGTLYCKFLYPSFLVWLCITASTSILMAICIERFIAVVYPLYFNRVISKQKAHLSVFAMWVLSVVQSVYTLFIYYYDGSIGYCASTLKSTGRVINAYYAFAIRLVIPVMTMLITQIFIAWSLQRQAKQFQHMVNNGKDAKPSYHLVARNRVLKMMLIVVLIYVVTWTPNQIAYLLFNLGYISSSYRGSPLHRILTVIAFINSCANPFIYGAGNPEFRKAVKGLFRCSKLHAEFLFDSGEKRSAKMTQNQFETPQEIP